MIQKIKNLLLKKHYRSYAQVIESIMSQKFQFEKVKDVLKLPFSNLKEYLNLVSKVDFKILNEFDNLKFYIGFHRFEDKLKKHLLQKSLYPIFLFVLSFCLTLYFEKSFAPTILKMLQNFDVHQPKLKLILMVSSFLKYIWYLLIIFFISMLSILLSKDLSYVLYIRFHEKKYFSLIRNILTIRFTYVYHFLLKHNLSSQECFKAMGEVSGLSDVKWISYHVKENILSGNDLIESFDLTYFSPFLSVYLQQGFYNQNLIGSLDDFLVVLEDIIINQSQRIIMYFKIFVYTYVVVFVAIYYLFLFQPLSILEGLV